MDKFQKVKLTLQKLLLQFGEMSTDKGLLEYTGEELVVGAEVFIDGNPAPDGEYKIAGDKVIVVADGKVAEIKEPAPAPEPEPEPAPETPVDEEGNPIAIIDPTKVNLNDLSTEEIMNLYKLSVDVKNNPKLNPIPLLPESIRNYIIADAKTMGFTANQVVFLAREMVLSFGSEISMDKEIQALQDEITRVMNIPEFMDFYGEALRDTYEVKLREEAEKETDLGFFFLSKFTPRI